MVYLGINFSGEIDFFPNKSVWYRDL